MGRDGPWCVHLHPADSGRQVITIDGHRLPSLYRKLSLERDAAHLNPMVIIVVKISPPEALKKCPRSRLRVVFDVVSDFVDNLDQVFPVLPALDPVEGQQQPYRLIVSIRNVRRVWLYLCHGLASAVAFDGAALVPRGCNTVLQCPAIPASGLVFARPLDRSESRL